MLITKFCIVFRTFAGDKTANEMKKTILYSLIALFMLSCATATKHDTKPTIYVSITPLKALAEELSCGDFAVEVIVPKGASPESYEPSPKQIAALSEAELIYEVGLINFEQTLVKSLNSSNRLINLSHGIAPLSGCCAHHHHDGHTHGIDPHIWTAPRSLKLMVENMRNALVSRYPDSTKYATAAESLLQRIDSLDKLCEATITNSNTRAMVIYHPAYTYFCRDYNIEQIAVEHEGKEPTPRQLTAIVERIEHLGVGHILHQPQYSPDKVRPIAEATDIDIVETDPLAEDILDEIERITNIICHHE